MIARLHLATLPIAFLAQTAAASPAAHPALIPLPTSVEWHKGTVPVGAQTVIEGDGEAESTATYLAQEFGIKRGACGTSCIRLSLVPATQIAAPEGYHLYASGEQVLIEASDPRGPRF